MSVIVEDRSLFVRPNQIIKTEWIHIDLCILGNRERMDFAAIERSGRKLLQMGDCQPWPPITGHWSYILDEEIQKRDRFIIHDGRHEFLASLALGKEMIFVAWLQET